MPEVQATQDVIETLGGTATVEITQDVIEYLFDDFVAPTVQITQDVIELLYAPISDEPQRPMPTCSFASSFVPGPRRIQGVCE